MPPIDEPLNKEREIMVLFIDIYRKHIVWSRVKWKENTVLYILYMRI